MAAATLTLTENTFPMGSDTTIRRKISYGTAVYTASPANYTAGGIAPAFAAPVFDVSSQTPVYLELNSIAGSGYVYQWVNSTNKVKIFTGAAAQSPLTELTDGSTIPAAVSNDVIEYIAHFMKGGV